MLICEHFYFRSNKEIGKKSNFQRHLLTPCQKVEYKGQDNADYDRSRQREVEDEVVFSVIDIPRQPADIGYPVAECQYKADDHYYDAD